MPNPRPRSRVPALLALVALVSLTGSLAALAQDPALLSRWAARRAVLQMGGELLGRDGVVLQEGLNDCGPAALANLARALGAPVPSMDSLGILAGTQPTGTRASGLVRAGRAIGLPLRVERITGDRFDELPVPFVAWVHHSHFVTVSGWADPDRLLVIDPQFGRYAIDVHTFRDVWSGEALFLDGDVPSSAATTVVASRFTSQP